MLVGSPARATEPFAQVVRYTGTLLNMSRGVRSLGMGNTGTADVSRSATGYFNPACFAWADAVTATVSNEAWPANLDLIDTRVSGAFPLQPDSSDGPWRFGGSLGYTELAIDPYVVRTIFLPEGTGVTLDEDDYFITGSAAAAWVRGALSFGAGVSAKYVNLAPGGVSTWAFDLGAMAAFPIQWEHALIRPRIGVSSLNLGPSVTYDNSESQLDHQTRGGWGLDVVTPSLIVRGRAVPAVSFSAEFDVSTRSTRADAVDAYGVEVSMINTVQVRFGEMIYDEYQRQTTYGVGLGWDWGSWLVQFDYARTNGWTRDAWGAALGARW
jgi:hypothetical protein